MIEIYLLEALCALAEYKTLSSASEHISVSQPALSRSMQKLEGILGVQLFDRSKNKIVLNETGKLAASMAKRILDYENDLITAVRNFDTSLHTLSGGYCAPGPMMEIQMNLSQLYPKMTLNSEIAEEEKLLEGLRNNTYGFIILSHQYEAEDVISLPCGSESLYFSLIPAHPASMFQSQGLTFEQMDGETFVIASEIGEWYDLTRKMMPQSSLIIQNSLESLSAIVNASTLPAFATDLTIRLFRSEENPQRVFVKILNPEATLHYHCVILKTNQDRYNELISILNKRYASTKPIL